MKQLESGFKETINCNKYQPKLTQQVRNRYFPREIPSFQEVNRLFISSFEDKTAREVHTGHYLPKTEIKYYNILIDGRNYFDQPVKIYLRTYDNIWKIVTGQGGDYTTGCLLDYPYFKEYYTLIAIDLYRQQKLDADLKAIHETNFTQTPNRAENAAMFFIIEEAKETILDFSKERAKVLSFYFVFNNIKMKLLNVTL